MEVSNERSQERINKLIEQLILLEEELQIVKQENRTLKENIINSNKNISNEIIYAVNKHIDSLKKEIYTPLPNTGILIDSINIFKSNVEDLKRILFRVEEEISSVLTISYRQYEEIQQKNKQIELYARINSKLNLIKDEYIRSKKQL